MLHEILRYKLRWYARPNPHLHTPPPLLPGPTPHLRNRALANHTSRPILLPHFPTSRWLAQEIRFETIGYRCSKTALNMLILDWSHKLKADGVKVWGVGPGMLETDLGG